MNIALPALVILLGLLPGLAFFYGYFNGRFDKRTAGVSGVEELALYVVFAIPLDAAALLICEWLGVAFNFDVVVRLVSGSTLSAQSMAGVAVALRGAYAFTAWSYTVVLIVAFLLGSAARRTVWTLRHHLCVRCYRDFTAR